jgi:chromosome segregation ATPase
MDERLASSLNDDLRALAARLKVGADEISKFGEMKADRDWAVKEVDQWWREAQRLQAANSRLSGDLYRAQQTIAKRDAALKTKRNECAAVKRKLTKLLNRVRGESV